MDKTECSVLLEAIEKPALIIQSSTGKTLLANRAFIDGSYPFYSESRSSYNIKKLDEDGVYSLCVFDTAKSFNPMKHQHLDPETGLYTRDTFETLVMCHLAEDFGGSHVMLLIRLKNYADIEKKHGTEIAAQYLRDAAMLLKGSIRGNDPICHFHKDSFAILACNVNETAFIRKRMEEVLKKLNQDFIYDDVTVKSKIKAGIAVLKGDDVTIERAFTEANFALKLAEASSTESIAYYGKD